MEKDKSLIYRLFERIFDIPPPSKEIIEIVQAHEKVRNVVLKDALENDDLPIQDEELKSDIKRRVYAFRARLSEAYGEYESRDDVDDDLRSIEVYGRVISNMYTNYQKSHLPLYRRVLDIIGGQLGGGFIGAGFGSILTTYLTPSQLSITEKASAYGISGVFIIIGLFIVIIYELSK